MSNRTIALRCFATLAVGVACTPTSSADQDPLDPALIHELALAQGSAQGDARSGPWTFEFNEQSCDCPSFEIDGEQLDLCKLASFATLEVELLEGSGLLGISAPQVPEFGLLTGAIEADGSFVVAGTQDLSNLAGSLEALRRMDGRFSADDALAEGWVGQRLIGEVPGQAIDCRWIGGFLAPP